MNPFKATIKPKCSSSHGDGFGKAALVIGGVTRSTIHSPRSNSQQGLNYEYCLASSHVTYESDEDPETLFKSFEIVSDDRAGVSRKFFS